MNQLPDLPLSDAAGPAAMDAAYPGVTVRPKLELVPVTLRQANAFVAELHRHHKPVRGWKFGVGLVDETGLLRGVAMAGRPVARALDNGRTIEVNRTCTDGCENANSMLYGAIWRAAKALGHTRGYTYTEEGETGASLKAAGWVLDAVLQPRANWADSSVKLKGIRDTEGRGDVARYRWIRT